MNTKYVPPAVLVITLMVMSCASPRTTTEDSAEFEEAITEVTTYPNELEVVPRAAWESVDPPFVIDKHEIRQITIHHGGETYREGRDTGEYLRSLQSWSRSDREWMDIPYHFVIDLEGGVYEARPIEYPGDTNTSYDPTGHALVVVVGNYEERELDEEQYSSLVSLTAFLAEKYDVDADLIKAHKDFAETACPGENIYRLFQDGSFVKDVQRVRVLH